MSNRTRRLAIDMTIHFQEVIKVRTGTGEGASVSTQSDLWPVGAAYGVQKLQSDPPHWSIAGH